MQVEDEIRDLLQHEEVKGLELLFHKYHQMVFKTAYYILKDKEEAKDMVQELFTKLWTQRTQLSQVDSFKSYLNTAMKNMALDHIRKNLQVEKNKKSYLRLEWDPTQPLEQDTTDYETLKSEIEQFVSELPPKCRLIFSLNRFEGLTNSEIADYLNLSPRTVEKQISIALKLLRQKAGYRTDKLLSLTFGLMIV